MKLRISQFCGLISSPDWQRWLYEYDVKIYNRFMDDVRNTTGCGRNKEIMARVLNEIENTGGSHKLAKFLKDNHPHIIKDQPQYGWQANFKTGLLTFPRRKIIVGDNQRDLIARINQFLSDKIKYEYTIVEDTAYIEYLEKGDEAILAKLPDNKWMLRKLRGSRH